MGLFDTKKIDELSQINAELTEKINAIESELKEKTNARYMNPFEDEKKKWNDDIQLSMSDNIVHNRTDVNSADHRYHQVLKNPFFFKLTFQIFKRILGKRSNRPYPFMYVKKLSNSDRNDQQTKDIQGINKGDSGSISEDRKSKLNASDSDQNSQRDRAVQDLRGSDRRPKEKEGNNQGNGLAGNRTQYERRDDLNEKMHALWDKEKLWDIIINCLSYACGVNSCAILRTKGARSENKYWVIPRNFFRKGYTKNRVLTKIDVQWPMWVGIEEEGMGIPMKGMETYTIGNNFILCTPFPSYESPYGNSYIEPYWQTGIYKEFLRLLQMMFYWKGGVISNHERIPATMSETEIENMKREYRKGLLSELQITKVSSNVSPELTDKMFSHESVYASGMDFNVGNSILSEDSLFPKQFIEGEAESGALGGESSNINKQEIDDTMFYFFYSAIEELVKNVNKVFFGLNDEDYTIVPYELEDANLDKNGDGLINSEDLNMSEESENTNMVSIKKEKKINSLMSHNTELKLNSSDIKSVYSGYILKPTKFLQDNGTYEMLDYDEIKSYIDDEKSVREFYLTNEHPKNEPMNVKKRDAIGKIEMLNLDENGIYGNLYMFEDIDLDEIELSPSYYSRDVVKDDGIHHSQIDIKNIVMTSNPRSKDLKLTKQNKVN